MTENKSDFNIQSAPVLDREDDLLAGSFRAGMLNQLLREQLSPVSTTQDTKPDVEQSTQTLTSTAVEAVSEILENRQVDRQILHEKLSLLFHQQKAVYEATPMEASLRNRQYIAASGLILSPENSITTQLDDLRVRSYVRGVDQAIATLLQGGRDSLNIVYPACGPFAPLLMPLLAYYKNTNRFSAKQLRVTFIDIQPGAIETLKALSESMGIEDYVERIVCCDALHYESSEYPIDIVVLEAMQHGFSREGQFSIARHFASMLHPEGILLPQQVVIKAALNDPNREFVAQWQDAKQVSKCDCHPEIMAERIELGEIARLNKHNLIHCNERVLDEHTVLIEFDKATIPPLADDIPEQVLLLCSEIQVFAQEWIREYDSGITHPLPDRQVCVNFTPRESRPGDLLVKSGDCIQFFYRVNGLPGFMATLVPGE